MNSAAQFTTHFECPARLYYLLARGSALSLFFLLSPNLTNALRFALSVAFYPTSRIVRVPLLRSESTRVEFLIHPPLFPLFFSRHVFLSACYDFSLFFFSLFLRGHSLCNNFPVVLACVLCTFLFPSPYVELFRRFENFYRAYILPPPRKKIPFMQFFKLPSIFIPESSRANHVSLITRVSLSLSLCSSVASCSSLLIFFRP